MPYEQLSSLTFAHFHFWVAVNTKKKVLVLSMLTLKETAKEKPAESQGRSVCRKSLSKAWCPQVCLFHCSNLCMLLPHSECRAKHAGLNSSPWHLGSFCQPFLPAKAGALPPIVWYTSTATLLVKPWMHQTARHVLLVAGSGDFSWSSII